MNPGQDPVIVLNRSSDHKMQIRVSVIILDDLHSCSTFLMENCSLYYFKLLFHFYILYRIDLRDYECNLVASVVKICGFAFVAGVQENQSHS